MREGRVANGIATSLLVAVAGRVPGDIQQARGRLGFELSHLGATWVSSLAGGGTEIGSSARVGGRHHRLLVQILGEDLEVLVELGKEFGIGVVRQISRVDLKKKVTGGGQHIKNDVKEE